MTPYIRSDYEYDPVVQRRLLPLYLPYTGEIPKSRTQAGDGEKLNVEHIVSLEEAHASGACDWPAAKKRAFAKDTLNQCLARASVNDEKSSLSIMHWHPPSSENRRWFAHTVFEVKRKWGLKIDDTEMESINAILHGQEGD